MDRQPTSKKREIIAVLAVLIVVVAIVAATTLSNKSDDTTDTANTTTGSTASTASDSQKSSANSTDEKDGTYKDGTYSATGSYASPGGRESITVKVTLKDGVITDTSPTTNATEAEAQEYQNMFLAAYKDLVVGKSIKQVSLSRVSGSSLTSQGFNNALDSIKQEAKTSA